jgi:hypothetical protein
MEEGRKISFWLMWKAEKQESGCSDFLAVCRRPRRAQRCGLFDAILAILIKAVRRL